MFHRTAVAISIGIMRVQLNSLVEVLERLLWLALGEINRAAIVIGPRVVFLDVRGQSEIIDGLVQLAEKAVCQTATVIGFLVLGVHANGLVGVTERFLG